MTEPLELLERIDELEGELARLWQQVEHALVQQDLPGGGVSIMNCRVGGHPFALLLDEVDEVLPVARTIVLPESPPWILGTLNLRGESVLVIDMTHRLLERPHAIRESELIVVAHARGRRVGLLVDEINDIETVSTTSLRHPAPGGTSAPHLLGMLHGDQDARPLLHVAKLVTPTEVGGNEL